jgi:putative ABC transport system permease protein
MYSNGLTRQSSAVRMRGVSPAGWRNQTRSFAEIAAQTCMLANLDEIGEPEKIQVRRVSTNFFSMFGAKPALGCDFLPEEEELKSGRVVILSQSVWQSRFNADPSLIGLTITLNDLPYAVVGILPPESAFPKSRKEIPNRSYLNPPKNTPSAAAGLVC